MFCSLRSAALFVAILATIPSASFGDDVVINEVADKGTSGLFAVCEEEEWIEIAATADVTLDGYLLFDDNGAAHKDNYTFPVGSSLVSGEKLVLCRKATFGFKIGTDDTITIADSSGAVVDTTGAMPGEGQCRDNKVWARMPDVTGAFQYSGTPTPDAKNVLSDPPTVPPVTTKPPTVLRPPTEKEKSNPDSSCSKLRAEFNLDCNACVADLPAEETSDGCFLRTVEDDTAAEIEALFADRKGGNPKKLYQESNFLFATDKVWKIEFDLTEASGELQGSLSNP